MGKRGPAPEPTALKKAKGNPGRRPLNDKEPDPPKGVPRCPEYLSEYAREEWAYYAPILQKMKLVSIADRNALATLCEALGRYREAEEAINEEGAVVDTLLGFKTVDGEKEPMYVKKPNPWLKVSNDAVSQMLKLFSRFGLTPSDRVSLRVEDEKDQPNDDSVESELEKRLNGTGKVFPLNGAANG